MSTSAKRYTARNSLPSVGVFFFSSSPLFVIACFGHVFFFPKVDNRLYKKKRIASCYLLGRNKYIHTVPRPLSWSYGVYLKVVDTRQKVYLSISEGRTYPQVVYFSKRKENKLYSYQHLILLVRIWIVYLISNNGYLGISSSLIATSCLPPLHLFHKLTFISWQVSKKAYK